MKTQKIGYVRVSSLDQNSERQLINVMDLDRVFTDIASGKDTNRPQLQAALIYAREGDTLFVHSMDRLARNVEDMFRLVRELNAKGVSIQFLKENITFSAGREDPRDVLMFTVLSAISQFERSLIRERQREGIAIAKRKGVYKGRKKALSEAQVKELKKRIGEGELKTKLAAEFGVSRETIHQAVKSASQPNHDNNKGEHDNGSRYCQ
jgi:DNA invertase Pin-like site-specific DNA recombinase